MPDCSFCLVTPELDGFDHNGGIGTHARLQAQLLGQAGWRIHIFYAGKASVSGQRARVERCLSQCGCALSCLEDFPIAPEFLLPVCNGTPFLAKSDLIARALRRLDDLHGFDFIEFPEYQALGFRTVQTKRAGLAFHNARIIVKLHSPSAWCREANELWMTSTDEARLDYCEQYSFRNADIAVSTSRYLIDRLPELGWVIPHDTPVIGNPHPATDHFVPLVNVAAPEEIVFYGRMETRKGLQVFVDAVGLLDPALHITFLGRDTVLATGKSSRQLVQERLSGRTVTIHDHWDREQALAYLMSGNRLAIMPSIVENRPNTVIECAAHGIPFLASNVGGIPEILTEQALRENLLFYPTTADLVRAVSRYRARDRASRQELCDRARQCVLADRINEKWLAQHEDLTRVGSRDRPALPVEQPLVSIVVTYYELPEYLPELLASLSGQDYPNYEVIVVDDGSASEQAQAVWRDQCVLYPGFRFVREENSGVCAARNYGLQLARGEFFIAVDADNCAHADMISRFVVALRRNPDLAGVSCYYNAFKNRLPTGQPHFEYAYRPSGGPFSIGAIINCYGDTNSMFRTEAVRAVGGFTDERGSTCEDWELFVKLACAGRQVDVLPEALFDYRHRPGSLIRTTVPFRNRQRVLRHYRRLTRLPASESALSWYAFASMRTECDRSADETTAARRLCEAFAADRDKLLAVIAAREQQLHDLGIHASQLEHERDHYGRLAALVEEYRDLISAVQAELQTWQTACNGLVRHCDNVTREKLHFEETADRMGQAYQDLAAICQRLIAEHAAMSAFLNAPRHRLADRVHHWLKERPPLYNLVRRCRRAGAIAVKLWRAA
jgi:glycosyltransferase involved in cell wall biosynthesis